MLGEASQRREKGRESRQITITSRGRVAGSYARLRAEKAGGREKEVFRQGWRCLGRGTGSLFGEELMGAEVVAKEGATLLGPPLTGSLP